MGVTGGGDGAGTTVTTGVSSVGEGEMYTDVADTDISERLLTGIPTEEGANHWVVRKGVASSEMELEKISGSSVVG